MHIKTILFLMILFCAQTAIVADAAPPPKFFSSMQDVPLVPGLTELTDQGVAFDKPEGRIIEAVAEIKSFSPDAIKKAYGETLPQLGWTKLDDRSFEREKESLTLNFESYGGRNFLRILVQPVGRVSN